MRAAGGAGGYRGSRPGCRAELEPGSDCPQVPPVHQLLALAPCAPTVPRPFRPISDGDEARVKYYGPSLLPSSFVCLL